MIEVFLLLAGLASGLDVRRLLLLVGAIHLPMAVGGLIGLLWLRARPDSSHRPSMFCEGVASELRAGATLRDALTSSASAVGVTVDVSLASPMEEVAVLVAEEFPSIGQELRLTVSSSTRSGSDVAALFDEIGSLALAQDEVRREVRVATAPGRATALLLIGAPVIYMSSRLSDQGLAEFLASSEQRITAMLGLGLFMLGLAGAGFVLWRSSR